MSILRRWPITSAWVLMTAAIEIWVNVREAIR